MKNYIKFFEEFLDKEWLKEHSQNLYEIECKQTFPAYISAAKYTYDLLKNENFQTEYLEFPADGKTVYQDKCMPIGWDASEMKLSLVTKVAGISDCVIADFSKDPLSAVANSVSTPPEGIYANIITEAQMLAGEDVQGALVLLNQATKPEKSIISMLLDLGAIGWVSDFIEAPSKISGSVNNLSAGTEYNSLNIQADDRDFISFNIISEVGIALRNACEHGSVKAHIVSDARRYETVFPAVTALLPGESEKEVWVISHLYRQFSEDNTAGVIGSIGILKALKEMAKKGLLKLKYSVRVVFSGRMYGLAAMCEHFGGDISNMTIGAINIDGIASSLDKSEEKTFIAKFAPNLPGFAGNIILDMVNAQMLETYSGVRVDAENNFYGDDCFISDSTVGCPCIWLKQKSSGLHSGLHKDKTAFDASAMVMHLSCCGAWIYAMAALSENEVREVLPFAIRRANELLLLASRQKVRKDTDEEARMKFLLKREQAKIRQLSLWGNNDDIENALIGLSCPSSMAKVTEESDIWFKYAESFTFKRVERGFAHDLKKLPKGKCRTLPQSIIYGPLADILSRLDGVKDLRKIISIVEYDKGVVFDDKTISQYIHALTMLADSGYLDMKISNPLTEEVLIEALKKLGVKKGDTIAVHSALSSLGYVVGGTKAVINALRSAVGESGTIMAPVFTTPYVTFDGTLNKRSSYRPYDTRPNGKFRDKAINTGALSKTMLKEKDSARSGHSTHEWVAIGKNASSLVSGHGLLDAPTGKTSPLNKALMRNGSVILLGCGVKSNTFIHYIETLANASYLQPAVIRYIDRSGTEKMGFIKEHLPGHRSFYDGIDSEFYKEALRRGLNISKVECGMNSIYKMELRELFEIGMNMFEDNPLATLCSNPECLYCKKFR